MRIRTRINLAGFSSTSVSNQTRSFISESINVNQMSFACVLLDVQYFDKAVTLLISLDHTQMYAWNQRGKTLLKSFPCFSNLSP